MSTMCSLPIDDSPFKAYCLMRGDRCIRITFSLSLAEHMARLLKDPEIRIERRKFSRGASLCADQTSSTGLYLITNSCGRPLRICLIQGIAQLLCDWEHRFMYECRPGKMIKSLEC